MSHSPGISPITPDIEDIRHSQDDGFFGEERGIGTGLAEAEENRDMPAKTEEADDLDALASASIEGGRSPAEPEGWWRSA